MTKIVIYSHTSSVGGAELALPSLAEALRADRVIVRGRGPLLDLLSDLRVEELSKTADKKAIGKRAALLAAFEILLVNMEVLRLVWRIRPDVVLANNVQSVAHLWLCGIIGRASRRWRTVVYIRDLGTGGNRSRPVTLALSMLIKTCAAGVVGNSRLTLSTWRLGPMPTIAVSTAVEQNYYDSWVRSDDQEGLVMVGRIAEWKGQARVLEAMRGVSARFGARRRIAIAGEAMFGDSKLELQDPSVQVDLLGHVSNPWELLRHYEFLVHASDPPEPFGQVLAQAAAAGIPILCADRGGHTEWLNAGESCLMVDASKPSEIARGIEAMLDDPDGALERSIVARRVAEKFSTDRAYVDLKYWLGEVV